MRRRVDNHDSRRPDLSKGRTGKKSSSASSSSATPPPFAWMREGESFIASSLFGRAKKKRETQTEHDALLLSSQQAESVTSGRVVSTVPLTVPVALRRAARRTMLDMMMTSPITVTGRAGSANGSDAPPPPPPSSSNVADALRLPSASSSCGSGVSTRTTTTKPRRSWNGAASTVMGRDEKGVDTFSKELWMSRRETAHTTTTNDNKRNSAAAPPFSCVNEFSEPTFPPCDPLARSLAHLLPGRRKENMESSMSRKAGVPPTFASSSFSSSLTEEGEEGEKDGNLFLDEPQWDISDFDDSPVPNSHENDALIHALSEKEHIQDKWELRLGEVHPKSSSISRSSSSSSSSSVSFSSLSRGNHPHHHHQDERKEKKGRRAISSRPNSGEPSLFLARHEAGAERIAEATRDDGYGPSTPPPPPSALLLSAPPTASRTSYGGRGIKSRLDVLLAAMTVEQEEEAKTKEEEGGENSSSRSCLNTLGSLNGLGRKGRPIVLWGIKPETTKTARREGKDRWDGELKEGNEEDMNEVQEKGESRIGGMRHGSSSHLSESSLSSLFFPDFSGKDSTVDWARGRSVGIHDEMNFSPLSEEFKIPAALLSRLPPHQHAAFLEEVWRRHRPVSTFGKPFHPAPLPPPPSVLATTNRLGGELGVGVCRRQARNSHPPTRPCRTSRGHDKDKEVSTISHESPLYLLRELLQSCSSSAQGSKFSHKKRRSAPVLYEVEKHMLLAYLHWRIHIPRWSEATKKFPSFGPSSFFSLDGTGLRVAFRVHSVEEHFHLVRLCGWIIGLASGDMPEEYVKVLECMKTRTTVMDEGVERGSTDKGGVEGVRRVKRVARKEPFSFSSLSGGGGEEDDETELEEEEGEGGEDATGPADCVTLFIPSSLPHRLSSSSCLTTFPPGATLYLGEPFYLFPFLRTLVSSYNVTTHRILEEDAKELNRRHAEQHEFSSRSRSSNKINPQAPPPPPPPAPSPSIPLQEAEWNSSKAKDGNDDWDPTGVRNQHPDDPHLGTPDERQGPLTPLLSLPPPSLGGESAETMMMMKLRGSRAVGGNHNDGNRGSLPPTFPLSSHTPPPQPHRLPSSSHLHSLIEEITREVVEVEDHTPTPFRSCFFDPLQQQGGALPSMISLDEEGEGEREGGPPLCHEEENLGCSVLKNMEKICVHPLCSMRRKRRRIWRGEEVEGKVDDVSREQSGRAGGTSEEKKRIHSVRYDSFSSSSSFFQQVDKDDEPGIGFYRGPSLEWEIPIDVLESLSHHS